MSEDRVVARRRTMLATARLDDRQTAWALETHPLIRRSVDEVREEMRRTALSERTLMTGKPRVTVTISVAQDGFQFPEDAQDVFELEALVGAFGYDVPNDVEHLVVMREARLAPSIFGDNVGAARDTDRGDLPE